MSRRDLQEDAAGGPWGTGTFEEKLREVGPRRYHDRHPFHLAMNRGELSPDQIRRWVVNRFAYQRAIPIKDAAIVSNCPLREVRAAWLKRIEHHAGAVDEPGGIERWVELAEAVGLSREAVWDDRLVSPAVRAAVDSYVAFARERPWPIAVASSLTELFAPDLMRERIAAFERHYPWIDPAGLSYFRARVSRARVEAADALALTLAHCSTPAMQRQAVEAVAFKCDLLWSMLDAIATDEG